MNFYRKIIFLCFATQFFLEVKLSYAQIIPDATLGSDSSHITNSTTNQSSIIVDRGKISSPNLFHSFLNFNVDANQSVYFANPQGIQNIISRTTGFSDSKILGKLGVIGDANLFLINPNGIIFGPESSLDIKGSFLATTANSVQFGSQGFFDSSVPNTPPELNIQPSALIFYRDKPAYILNRSKVLPSSSPPNSLFGSLFGLSVPAGKNLLLVGGDISLEGGGIYTLGGSIELGSVVGLDNIQLNQSAGNISLSYPNNAVLGNISLADGAVINVSGERGGDVHITGKNIYINSGSQVISNTVGSLYGGTLKINATESVELIGFSKGGVLSTNTYGSGNAGAIKIATGKLLLDKGAQVSTASRGSGTGGDIEVTASESVEIANLAKVNIFGTNVRFSSGLLSDTLLNGNGGNITINAPTLLVRDDAKISTDSSGILAFLNGKIVFLPATGKAGELKVTSHIILLSNKGFLSAKTNGGAGNIKLVSDTIILRNNSGITTNASGKSSGGNITINTSLLLALSPNGSEGSDIVAKADVGSGGNITINAKGIFGIQERKANLGNQTNDIDASSQFGQSGQVQINTTTDPNQGLIELPTTVIDPSTLVAQNPCRRASSSEFTRSGRGGLPPSLSQDLNSESTQVGLVEPTHLSQSQPQKKPVLCPYPPQKLCPPKGGSITPKAKWCLSPIILPSLAHNDFNLLQQVAQFSKPPCVTQKKLKPVASTLWLMGIKGFIGRGLA
jgi:filamentous hemagglutinin family protein